MKHIIKHITLTIATIMMVLVSTAQIKTRYVEIGSTHALSINENTDYRFEWSIQDPTDGIVPVSSTTANTGNIVWDLRGRYHVTVVPLLDTIDCYGENVKLDVVTVDYLSLHTFDDVFFTTPNTPLEADVSLNDFDDRGNDVYYNSTLVQQPSHGTVSMGIGGVFIYTPDSGFEGVDEFVYEAFVREGSDNEMYSNSKVTIVVENDVRQSDLYIEKTGPEKALYGQTIQYFIKIINKGPDAAQNVIVKDTLAFGLFDAEYKIGNDDDFSPWSGFYSINNLGRNDSVIIYLRAVVSKNSPNVIYNQAITWSGTYDPDYADNDSIWRTDISTIYADLPGQVHVASCETYTMPGDSSDSNIGIDSYNWSPATGLSNTNTSNPVFTPDSSTFGRSIKYIYTVTDTDGNQARDSIELVVAKQPVAVIEADTLYKDLNTDIVIDASGSKGEEGLYFSWSTNDGEIESRPFNDSVTVSSIGTYHLEVKDRFGCTSYDSVLVLLQSYPPVALEDSVSIVAGDSTVLPGFGNEYLALSADPEQQRDYLEALPDSNLNVLVNDYDRNGFDINVTEVLTPPSSGSVSYRWDSTGMFVLKPDASFWGTDSLQYRVCNNGRPVKCNTAWLYIHSVRPPLNADVQIVKRGENIHSNNLDIAFWGDTIRYSLQVTNNGPDTISTVTVNDVIHSGLLNPKYSHNGGDSWDNWPLNDRFEFTNDIKPGEDTLTILLKAFIREEADSFITNTAYIETAIIENNFTNDTSSVTTKIKEMVLANAGRDTLLGSCIDGVDLDGNLSSGEDISYQWSPVNHATNYLTGANTATPRFENPGTAGDYQYMLTVTDDDNISATDTVTISVLPPPEARAVKDYYEIVEGDTIGMDGGASRPSRYITTYEWSTIDGNIIQGADRQRVTAVNAVGTYQLTVTDIAGCKDSVDVPVYRFYYPPVAIPDYYSGEVYDNIKGNLLYNDFDPNKKIFGEDFELKVVPKTIALANGQEVVIQENGDFTFTPRQNNNVFTFTYDIYNDAELPKTDRGYVRVTVNDDDEKARLNIRKESLNEKVLIGEKHDAEFRITIINDGPEEAERVLLTDSFPEYFRNDAVIHIPGRPVKSFDGAETIGDIKAGDSISVEIKVTVAGGAPEYLFNAAMASTRIYDDEFDWDDVSKRNVDTASVITESNLLADIKLVELFDDDRSDATIGRCDTRSYLTGIDSKPADGINGWSWSPREYLTHPDSSVTYFNFNNLPQTDTTITFSLMVSIDGGDFARKSLDVRFSPKVIADAGPDVKINEGEVMIVDEAFAQGSEMTIEWVKNGSELLSDFEGGNPLRPIITETGMYRLVVKDKHGCSDFDEIIVKENSLYLVDDIINVVEGDTIVGNVSTNDFDPDGDSIYYTGNVSEGPFHGVLVEYPMTSGIEKSALAENRIGADGSFVYIPDPGYSGYDYFIYEGCDDNLPNNLCKEAIVHIAVVDIDDINTRPVINPDYLFANHGDTIRTNLLANDYDPDGGELTIDNIFMDPVKGKILNWNSNGEIVYVLNENVSGTDRFVYRACDNGTTSGDATGCDTASVVIEIHKIAQENHSPVAVDDAYYVVEKTIEGNILDNDYDPDGDAFSLIRETVEGPYHGSFDLNRDGSFTYTPNPGYEGTDQIVYQIQETEGDPLLSDMATVYIVSLSESRYKTDVVMTKKTMEEEMLSGGIIEYELKVKIAGPSLANDVVFSDELDSSLTEVQYSSDGGLTWFDWEGTFSQEQMMLYEEKTIKIRARVPDIYAGDLPNTACVDHDMNEMDEDNNCSEVLTGVYQQVIADAGSDTIIGACNVESFYLDASNSVGMSSMEYLWESLTADIQNPDAERTGIVSEPNTTSEFMLVVTSSIKGFNDSDTSYVTVTVDRDPQAWAGNDVWPFGDEEVILDGSSSIGADGGLDYSWWIYDVNENVEVLGESATLVVNSTNDYYLTITDKYGCTNTDMVHVGYPIDKYIAIDDSVETFQQNEIDINVLANDIIDEDDEYDFEMLMILDQPEHGELVVNPYDSTVTYIPDPYYFGPDTFSYQMSTVNNFTDAATVYINVVQRLPVIPDGFSPNADGINDYLIIENIELYPDNSITIFNRWGNVIYEKAPYSNDTAWDGVANKGIRIGSGVVPTGVYLYIIDLGDDDRLSQKVYKGNLYIASENRR